MLSHCDSGRRRTESKILPVARDHKPRATATRHRSAWRGAREARGYIRLVHRGLRYRRFEGSEGAARRTGGIDRERIEIGRPLEFRGTIRKACSGSLGESAATVSSKEASSNGIPVRNGANTQN